MDFSILSRYDDFLANYFLDSLILWFPTIRMNSDLVCGMVDTSDAIPIIRQRITHENNHAKATKEFIQLPLFQEFLKNKGDRQIFEFTQHMRRYMCLFMPNAGFEVGCTTRYTGEMEACIIAAQDWKVGDKVALCQGSIAKLTAEEDEILKSEGRDFSVMVSTRKKCACLFLGPARFMNHDCDANCEFILVGSNAVTFKVNRNIKRGEEMTVFYGKHYFGEDNCECLCASCERRQEGGFSKSEKTVVESPVEEIVLSSTRSSSRKRKENIDGHDYVSERVSKKSMLNHINSDQQKSILPVDENQYAPISIVAINENGLCESQSQCIPEKTANDNRRIVIIDDDDMLKSNCDSQKENATVSEMVLDTITAKKSELEVMRTSTPSGDAGNLMIESSLPVEIGGLDVENRDLVVEKELTEVPSSNDDGNENENSVEDAKVPLTRYSEKSNEQLVECNLEVEKTSQGSKSIISAMMSNDGKSVTTMSGAATIVSDDSPVEIDVDSLPVIDEGPSLGPGRVYDLDSNASDLENTITPISIEDDSNNIENRESAEDYATHSSNKCIEDTNKESTTDAMNRSKSQTPVDTDTLGSNECKDTEIAFSEGFSDKAKSSPKAKKATRLFRPENSIRQVRSVVINHESDKRLASKKIDLSSCRTVCDIWIPVNKYTKKKVNTTLQELNDDMQKMIEMEKTETEARSAQDHSNSSDNIREADPERRRDLEYIYNGSSTDEDEEKRRAHKVVEKDKPFHASSTSTSSSVCHNNDDDVSLRSETQSTYSINESENFSVRDEYTPNTEPELIEKSDNQTSNAFTCNDHSLQTTNSRASINSPTDSSSSSSSSSNSLNDLLPPSAKSRFIELIDPPTAIIREEEVVKEPKAISETTHFSFLRNMSDPKSQHEKDRVMVLDDLSRSYTSSSNDSVCFSSNDFDPTDMSSPLSVSSNDSILPKQDDMESCHQHEPDANSIAELNSYSTKTNSSSVFKESSNTEIASMKQPNTLSIPKEYKSADISHSNLPHISTSVDPTHTTSISSSTTTTATMDTMDQNMDLNSTGILDLANSAYSIDSTPDPIATNSCQTNTESSVNASIPANMTLTLNFADQRSTENTIKLSNIPNPNQISNLSANSTSTKRCCPDFEKYASKSNVNSSMCPRCLRHFNIFGVEWPKRIGKKRPKYKTKGTKWKATHAESSKLSKKKDPRTKTNISKQRPKQKSESSHEPMDLDSSENTTSTSSEQLWRDESEWNHTSSTNFTSPSKSLKKSKSNNVDPPLKDKEETVSLDIENKGESQSTSTDQSDTPSVPVTKPPRKRKPKRDYYYYKLVPINEEPEPEQIIVNPDKPYGLRVNHSATHSLDNHNHQKKHQKKEKPKPTSSQLPKETNESAAQSSNENHTDSTSKAAITKKKKKRKSSPRITAKKRYRAGSRSSRSKTPVRNPLRYRPKTGYYEWVIVYEDDDAPEEIPINTDPSKPYNFRTRDATKTYSGTLSHEKKPQDKDPKQEEPSQDSTLEATLGNSSQQKEKLDQVTPENSTQETRKERPSCQLLNRYTRKSIREKPKVSSNHVEVTEKYSRPRPIEKEIINISPSPSPSPSPSSSSSSSRQRKIVTRSSSILTDKDKSDTPSDNVSLEKSCKRHPEKERKINTRSSSKESQTQVREQPSETKNESMDKSSVTVISRNYNTRYSEKSAEPPAQHVMTGKPLKKVNIQQRNRLETTSSPVTLENKKKITNSKKRPLDSVEKSRVGIPIEPPSKKPCVKQLKQSNVVAASAKPEFKIPSKPVTRSSSRSKETLTPSSNERIFKKPITTRAHSEPVVVKYATRSKA